MTKRNKILSYIIAVAAFIGAALFYHVANLKGFPDGHLTELDRAERPLFYISTVLCLLTGLFLLYLARLKKTKNGNTIFYGVLISLFIVMLIIIGLEWHFISNLDHGTEG